jgi:putative DNA methylase
MKRNKKLIEVALPLEAINTASAREKSIRHGHPSTLHLWWARRPLAAARAVIFAQMVDDPSAHPDIFETEKAQEKERKRLFKIIEDLVKWENTTNEEVLERARAEIWQSWRYTCAENADHPRAKELFDRHKLPGFHDPFAGGGALPLEAQRLGLESYASDLNPVAVLINKAMIEIPPKFAGKPPVNPEARKEKSLIAREWKGAQGLAEDVRYYGQWMRDEAEKRIGHLYPKVEVTIEMAKARPDLKAYVGRKLTVIAWLWARTVKSPNPAFAKVDVPLASTFMLSTKAGKEAYVEPVIENGGYRFTVKVGKPKDAEGAKLGTTLGKRAAFRCLMSDAPVTYDHIREQGKAGRMGARLMAIVAEGDRGRVYLAPTPEHEAAALKAEPAWKPDVRLPVNPRDFKTPNYGLMTFADLFTPRQLVALTTFSDLVQEARERVQRDALAAGLPDNAKPLRDGGIGATAYADAVCVYLAFAVDRMAMTGNNLVRWNAVGEKAQHCFGRQALPMMWDFGEPNFLGSATGSVGAALFYSFDPLNWMQPLAAGVSTQADAATQDTSSDKLVSTDPPYYDNIGYADLSDFFYVWLRRSLRQVFPDLFATLAVPKAEELVATPYRHGSKEKAESFFLDGMTHAMHRLAEQTHPAFPVTIYYAFKQSESDGDEGTTNTGWDTFLAAVIEAGFAVSGTWPIRTEMRTRQIAMDTNALASSIILVCRQRDRSAPTATRREFVNALKAELPPALLHLQRGNIAPVDLAQAAIGPGMAVYTRYASILDAEGRPLSVREALTLINQTLDEVLAEQEGDFDADSRWALSWFEQMGFAEGEFGVAETLSKAKNTSVTGMVAAGIVDSARGRVRLLKPSELPGDWDPKNDPRLTAWEMVHHLIRVLEAGGEGAAAEIVAKLGGRAEIARELCYRLYTISERKRRAQEALSYNALVQSWPEIMRLAGESKRSESRQSEMFE